MIEIESFKRIGCGHLLAVADIVIPEWHLKIQGVAIFNKNGAKWVNLPQKTYQGSDGKTKYTDTMQWTDKGVEGRFRDAVLDALKAEGHLESSTAAPKKNRKNPDRMTYGGGAYRPDDFQGVQPPDDLPY